MRDATCCATVRATYWSKGRLIRLTLFDIPSISKELERFKSVAQQLKDETHQPVIYAIWRTPKYDEVRFMLRPTDEEELARLKKYLTAIEVV